jgi:hypothetical protein
MQRLGSVLFAGGLLALLLLPPAAFRAADTPVENTQLQSLIGQLGSNRFLERQAATEALDKIGEPALPYLREAIKSNDLEVRRRAEDLIPRIEMRLDTSRALTPLKVHFACKDKTVPEAVAEFIKQTGHPLQLMGDQSRLANRRITLDTGDTTFWDAYEQFCAKAGLREAENQPDIQPNQNVYYTRNVGRVRAVRGLASSYYQPPRMGADQTLVLEDGAAKPTSVAKAGALRIRSLPPKSGVFSDLPDGGKQINLHLEVRSEARVDLTELIGLRVTRANDEAGKKIRYASDYIEGGLGDYGEGDIVFLAQQMDFLEGNLGGGGGSLRQIPITLIVDGKTIPSLGELSGTLSCRIRTAPEALVSLDDVAKAVGKSYKAGDGSDIKITECKRDDDGLFKIKVELKSATIGADDQFMQLQQLRLGGRARVMRGGIVQQDQPKIQLSKENANTVPFKLVNAKGEALEFVNGDLDVNSTNDLSRVYTLVYKPAANDTAPAKFEYIGRREVLVEVPFTLKDIPLLPKSR